LGKTYGLEFVITPNSMWSITLNGILSPYSGTLNTYTGEGIVVYKPDATWSFTLDGQYGNWEVSSGPSYYGVALYGKCQIQSDYDAVLRLESLSDAQDNAVALYGNTDKPGEAFTGTEATLTLEHDFTANMIARLEGRVDMASYNGSAANVFATSTTPISSQVTGTASVAYTF
jgi:hypothetical protein